jgi:hypothetical protein
MHSTTTKLERSGRITRQQFPRECGHVKENATTTRSRPIEREYLAALNAAVPLDTWQPGPATGCPSGCWGWSLGC